MRRFPASGSWTVAHGKEFFADIVHTQNMDFSRPGLCAVAPAPNCLYTQGDDSDFGDPLAIVPIASTYYTLTDDEVFTYSPSNNSFTNLSNTSQPTFGSDSDAISYQGFFHASGGTVVKWWDGNSWEAGVTGLSSNYPHPLCIVEQLNQLAVADGNTVKTYNTSYSLQATLTIPSEYIITGLRWRQNKVYIFTRNIYGRDAKMFEWVGTGTSAQAAYGVGADWIYSGCEFMGSMCVITSAGLIMRFNGGGFDELAALPVYYSPFQWTSDASTSSLRGRVSNRGMVADGMSLLINLDGRVNVSDMGYVRPYLAEQPSGLWKYDPTAGLHHLAGFPRTKYSTISISSLSDSTFTMASAHGASTGDPVYLNETTGITGITEGSVLFAIVTSTTALKLATTPEDARAGRNIAIAGTVSGDSLSFYSTDGYGATDDILPGPVAIFSQAEVRPFIGTRCFFGGVSMDDAGNDVNFIASLGLGRNTGSFVTTPIEADGATDTFQKLLSFIEGIRLDTERAVIKYRTVKSKTPQSIPADITWSSSTTFTVNPYTEDVRGLEVGDEMTILSGAGAGVVTRVTEFNDPPSLVTVSTEVPGADANDVSVVVFEKWKELLTMSTTSSHSDIDFGEAALGGKAGKYIQFKIELHGFGIGARSLTLINKPRKANA